MSQKVNIFTKTNKKTMEASKEIKAINDEIINQMVKHIGGARFITLTGSKPLAKSNAIENPYVTFKLARNTSKATHLKLIYNSGLDLYEMKFIKVSKLKITTVEEKTGLYSDMLEEVFTQVTGLCTRL